MERKDYITTKIYLCNQVEKLWLRSVPIKTDKKITTKAAIILKEVFYF